MSMPRPPIGKAKSPVDRKIRGRDISPLLRGQPPADWDNDFYGEYSTHHQSQTHMRMYRTPRWKLVRDYRNPDRDEFFDLKNDPAESKNLLGEADVQDVIAQLDKKLRAKMLANGDEVAAKPAKSNK